MSAAVGADVESICSKCGDVWHVVVAKVGERIVKVICKECGRQHRYKPPGGSAPKRAGGEAAPRSSRRREVPAPPPPPPVAFDPSKPPRRYSIEDQYEVGDRIDHPRFGVGVAESLPGPGRVQVRFSDGIRILAQAKPAARLAPPTERFPS